MQGRFQQRILRPPAVSLPICQVRPSRFSRIFSKSCRHHSRAQHSPLQSLFTEVSFVRSSTACKASSAVLENQHPAVPILSSVSSERLEDSFVWEQKLASGGNAEIYLVKNAWTGAKLACKCIPKDLSQKNCSEQKRRQHQASIQKEILALETLQDCPYLIRLRNTFEDEAFIYIVMELCEGGELNHTPGYKAYTESQVSQIMASVLTVIDHCHTNGFLHRDIKPGNFILARDGDLASIRAIDFGLAEPYDESDLPLDNLGLEGTAWYMAPEVLSSKVGPSSDVWSAGVMTAQLLTGRLPFDDFKNPLRPAITKIWQAILCKDVDFKKSCWGDISESGKDFVKLLLQKDPELRPSAKEALQHPWLAKFGSTSLLKSQVEIIETMS